MFKHSCSQFLFAFCVYDNLLFRSLILRSHLSCYFEPKNLGLIVVDLSWQGDLLFISSKEFMGKWWPKVRSVKSVRLLLRVRVGNVQLFTLTAVGLHSACSEFVTHSTRHHALIITESARTLTIHALQVFAIHNGETLWGLQVPRMHQTVHVWCFLV